VPVYTIEGPDGKRYKIDGPEGATADELSEFITSAKMPVPTKGGVATAKKDEPGFFSNLGGGLKTSVLDTVQGIRQLASEADSAFSKTAPGKVVDNALMRLGLSSADDGLKMVNAEVNARREAEKPMMDTWGGNIGNIAGSVAQLLGPGLAAKGGSVIRNALLTPKNVGQAATTGAGFGGVQAVADDESRGNNTLLGAAGAAGGYGAAKGIGALAQSASKVTPEIKALAEKAMNKWGIEINAPQVANNRFFNTLQSVVKDVPFSGASQFQAKQQGQVNRAVAKTMGESSDNVSTAIESAEKRLGPIFDKTLKAIKADDAFIEGLAKVEKNANDELVGDQLKAVQKQLNNVMSAIKESGDIDGQAGYNIKIVLDRISKGGDSTLAHHARALQAELMGALNRSLGPEEAAAFKTVREQYKNMLTAEKVVSNDGAGNIPMGGARLVQEAKKHGATDLEEIGRIANQFLRDKTPDSGTARRMFVGSALGGSAIVNPMVLGAIPAARAASGAMNSRFMTNHLLNGSGGLKGASSGANLLLRPAATEEMQQLR
jgi:hypothetical protein